MTELPNFFQTNLPHWLQLGAILLGFVGTGIKNNPDALKDYGSAGDWLQISAIISAGSSLVLAHGKDKQAQMVVEAHKTAIDEAAKAPPVDAEGNCSSRLSVTTAIKQAFDGGEDDLGIALGSVLKEHGTHGNHDLPQPGSIPERGAA